MAFSTKYPTGQPLSQTWGRNMATSYNRPSAGVAQGLKSLVSGFNQAYGQAKAANEARYQQLLNIASQTTQQRVADIKTAFGQRMSGVMQQLARLGMSNTTIAPTMQMGVEREQQSSLDRLADTMQQTKLGIIEGREDPYPDRSSIESIIAGVGSQYGGGQGLQPMLQALAGLRS